MRIPRSIVLVAVGVIGGATIVTGVAVGMTAGASGPSTTYYACLKAGRLTHVGTTAPTCKSTATQISWNSVGPQGPPGAPSPVTGYSVIKGTERDTMSTSGAWTSLPEASLTVQPQSSPATIAVRFWASPACFGSGRKYAQVMFNGAPGDTAPLAAYPTVDSTSQEEIPVSLEDSLPVSTSSPVTVSINIETDDGSSCVFTPGEWQMTVETVSS